MLPGSGAYHVRPGARASNSMSKRISIFLIFLFTLSFQAPVCATEPLRIAYPTFAPFHYVNEEGKLSGFFYEIITEAVQNRLGIALKWQTCPWARCQQNVKNNLADALLTVPTRQRSIYTQTHVRPFYRKSICLFTYKGHPRRKVIEQLRTISDIKKEGFSVITYSQNGWHKKHVASLGIISHETSQLDTVWQMLAGKRGDIVMEWPGSALSDIKRLNLQDRVIYTGVELAAMEFHLLIRKGSPYTALLTQFDTVIQQMVDDGTMEAILTRYQ